jgi:tetratricopeptide (TPR) repeat protein
MFYKAACFISLSTFSLSLLQAQDSTLTRLKRSNLSKEHYENGISYFNKRSYALAISEFELAISLNALDPVTYYFNGLSYERIDNFPKALLNYNLSISIDPDFSEARFNRAIVYYKLEKYKKAIKDLEQLLLMAPGETQAVYFRGINYGKDDSDPGFDTVISMSNKEADLFNYIGLSYYQLNLFEQAKTNFEEAVKRNPDDENIQVNLGLTYLAMNNLDSARYHFQESLSINPSNAVAQYNLSLCQTDSSSDQIKQLDLLILKSKNFPMAYAQRAYQHYIHGNYMAAIADYDSAILLDPDNSEYYLERGILLEKVDEIDLAMKDFKTALTLSDNNFKAWYNLANAFFLQNNYKASIEYYSQAIDLNPEIPYLYYNRSLAYYYLKDMGNACNDMKKAQSLGYNKSSQFILLNCE